MSIQSANSTFFQRFGHMDAEVVSELYIQLSESGHDPDTVDDNLAFFYAKQIRVNLNKFHSEQMHTPKVRAEDSEETKEAKRLARFAYSAVDDDENHDQLSSNGDILDQIEYEERLQVEERIMSIPLIQDFLSGALNHVRPVYREDMLVKALRGIIPDEELYPRAKAIALAITRSSSSSDKPKEESLVSGNSLAMSDQQLILF